MKNNQEIFHSIDSSVISAFTSVYKIMTDFNLHPIYEANKNDHLTTYSTTMGLNGYFVSEKQEKIKFKASTIISWQISDYLKMAGRILGEEYKEFCAELNDVGMEVLNTTVGNSKPLLNKHNIFVEMSLPTAFLGKQFYTESAPNIFSKIHLFDTEEGKVCITINCQLDG